MISKPPTPTAVIACAVEDVSTLTELLVGDARHAGGPDLARGLHPAEVRLRHRSHQTDRRREDADRDPDPPVGEAPELERREGADEPINSPIAMYIGTVVSPERVTRVMIFARSRSLADPGRGPPSRPRARPSSRNAEAMCATGPSGVCTRSRAGYRGALARTVRTRRAPASRGPRAPPALGRAVPYTGGSPRGAGRIAGQYPNPESKGVSHHGQCDSSSVLPGCRPVVDERVHVPLAVIPLDVLGPRRCPTPARASEARRCRACAARLSVQQRPLVEVVLPALLAGDHDTLDPLRREDRRASARGPSRSASMSARSSSVSSTGSSGSLEFFAHASTPAMAGSLFLVVNEPEGLESLGVPSPLARARNGLSARSRTRGSAPPVPWDS